MVTKWCRRGWPNASGVDDHATGLSQPTCCWEGERRPPFCFCSRLMLHFSGHQALIYGGFPILLSEDG